MADSRLSREHSLALLQKLATDDAYRARYQEKPAAALAELGVPLEIIVNLKASCLASTTLADKGDFQAAHAQLTASATDQCLTMVVPSANVGFDSTDN